MSSQSDDFEARMKRVRAKVRNREPVRIHSRATGEEPDGFSLLSIVRPQLAFVLGAVALVVCRGVAMNYLPVEKGATTLGWIDGAVVIGALVVIGLLFGKSDRVSHVALLVGAWVAFITEGYYIRAFPELMSQVYSPGYVGLVMLGG
ncbi:MAG TPA: hypothetical protein VLA52_14275 [Thermohalobaculum sp.]|nr:hypothetical protein [Thermohalobaculum sp.]